MIFSIFNNNSKISPTLYKSIFGLPISNIALIGIGAGLGLFNGIDPNNSIEPFLYFILPGWIFYTTLILRQLLSRTRENSWVFILGISYKTKMNYALKFSSNSFVQSALFLLSCSISLSISQFVFYHEIKNAISCSLLFALELLVFYIFLLIATKLNLFKPPVHDQNRFFLFPKKLSFFTNARDLFIQELSIRISQFAKGLNGTLLYRFCLYFFRTHALSYLLFMIGFLSISSSFIFLFNPEHYRYVSLLIFIGAAFVLYDSSPCISELVYNIKKCTYYPRSLMYNNSSQKAFALFTSFPFCIIVGIMAFLAIAEYNLLNFIIYLITVIFVFTSLALSFVTTWQEGKSLAFGNGITLLATFCGLLGLVIPYAGLVFALVPIFLIQLFKR